MLGGKDVHKVKFPSRRKIIPGNSVVLPLVSYKLQIDDSVIGFVGSLFKIASLIIKGLAAQPWMLYLSECP